MNKLAVSALMGVMCCGAQAASFDNISVSGFGSIAVGKANNDSGYAGYDSDWSFDPDTLVGVQLDAGINDKTKFVAQVVVNGRYDYAADVEMAYLSYEFDSFTARFGKLRTPLFMYSDYLDVGYAYPMLRPSQEVYENIIISSYMGVDLLIPIEFEDSELLLQPLFGQGKIEERDSSYGEVTLDQFLGLAAHWYVDDFTFRASYVTAVTDYDADPSVQWLIDDKRGQYISLGMQYDNGDFIGTLESAQTTLEDEFSDVLSVSALAGYRFGEVMPYVMLNWMETTDDDEREGYGGLLDSLNYNSTAYSLGVRWDFAANIALKVDATYSDFDGTSAGIDTSEEDTVVYSTALDFIF